MSNKNDDRLKLLLETFQAEAKEHIATINRALLTIERGAEDTQPQLQDAFRAAHNLKGSARMVGLTSIEALAHKMENTLQSARDGDLVLDADACDIFYDALDMVENMLNDDEVDTQPVEQRLADLQPETTEPAQQVAPEVVTSDAPVSTTAKQQSNPPEEQRTQKPDARPGADTIRVTVDKLDDVLAEIGELQVSRMNAEQRSSDMMLLEQQIEHWQRRWNEIESIVASGNGSMPVRLKESVEAQSIHLHKITETFNQFSQALNRDTMRLGMVSTELRDKVRRVRMLPFSSIALGLERVVRDAAHHDSKVIDFKIEGDDTELDKKVLEILKDPLMHLLRNSVSHGIESPDERNEAGKPSNGFIKLSLQQRGSEVHIQVADDGRGFNAEALKTAYQSQNGTRDDIPENLLDLAFRPGISTSQEVNALSGRGVGLDVVRQQLESIQGRIGLYNIPGQGVTISLVVPTSLAVTRALLVEIGAEQYAIPLLAIEKIVETNDVLGVGGKMLINIEGQHLPLVSLADVLERPIQPIYDEGLAIIIAVAEQRIAVLVDNVITEQELAVKPLGSLLEVVPHVTGAALLGDGLPIVVLNPADIIRSSQKVKYQPQIPVKSETEDHQMTVHVLVVDDSITTRTLEQNILEAEGYLVRTATNGVEALQQLDQQMVDIVISDVQMPQMDGIELTRHLRRTDKYKQLPIILVTSLESKEDKEQGMHAGADAYIVKRGFSQTELLMTIEQLI